MDRHFRTQWSGDDGHPSEDKLLLFVDGELPIGGNGGMRSHLEACWSCRVRTEKIQETISSFIDYRNQVLKPLLEPPPNGWRGFDRKLNALLLELGKPSIFSSLLSTLSRPFYWERRWDLRRAASLLRLDAFRIHRLHLTQVFLRPATALLTVLLLASVLVYLTKTPAVSVSEILRQVSAAQEQQLGVTNQAVIYQKLQLTRKSSKGAASSDLVTWEVWNDTANSRFRQSVDASGARKFVETGDHSSLSDVVKLQKVLLFNHMNPRQPLSPASYEAWRQTIEHRNEEVVKTKLANGREALTLTTSPTGDVGVGALTEASLVVRTADWHPVEERLRVRGEHGEEEFEITETAYSVVSLNVIDPAIFADWPATPNAESSPGLDSRNSKIEAGPLAANLPPLPAMPTATTALEIEVLQLLNQAGADVTEQVSVSRKSDGLLLVEGIVETEKRKNELLQALQPVSNNSAVEIAIQTVAEASQRQAQQKQKSSNAIVVERVEVTKGAMAAEADLRRYFSTSGADTDEKIREFASLMINHSQRALFQASALRRLAGRFSLDQLRALDARDRERWLSIIHEHARALQQATRSLRQELRPVFLASAMPEMSDQFQIANDADLLQAISHLYELAAANDRIVRSAFTISADSSPSSALKAPHFWRSLSAAEGVAQEIGRANPARRDD